LLYGAERTARSPRTRMNARYLSEDGFGGEDGLLSLSELKAAALSGRGILAEDLLAEVVTTCQSVLEVDVDGEMVDVTAACSALAGWDSTSTLEQRGVAVWRELLGSGLFDSSDLTDAGELMLVPFDADDPVDTPRGLSTDGPVLEALGRAVLTLDAAGIEPDAALGDIQFTRKDGVPIPILGGPDLEGVIAIATYSSGNSTRLEVEDRAPVINGTTDLTEDGYQVNYGNSFVMAVELGDAGPTCEAIMTYSQSDDSTSPHFDDQTILYGEGSMRPCHFDEADVAGATVEQVTLTLAVD
jgi:acyl-homoserine-lactone acylase